MDELQVGVVHQVPDHDDENLHADDEADGQQLLPPGRQLGEAGEAGRHQVGQLKHRQLQPIGQLVPRPFHLLAAWQQSSGHNLLQEISCTKWTVARDPDWLTLMLLNRSALRKELLMVFIIFY